MQWLSIRSHRYTLAGINMIRGSHLKYPLWLGEDLLPQSLSLPLRHSSCSQRCCSSLSAPLPVPSRFRAAFRLAGLHVQFSLTPQLYVDNSATDGHNSIHDRVKRLREPKGNQPLRDLQLYSSPCGPASQLSWSTQPVIATEHHRR